MSAHATESKRWYVLRTKPKQERRAELNLFAWGVETLAPRVREPRESHVTGKLEYREIPLFPTYIFAKFDVGEQVMKIRQTRGVHSVVGFGECATAVDDSVIETVRSRIHDDGFVHIAEPVCGDTVEVMAGPLRSWSGVFERSLSSRDRALILLATVGAKIRVELPKAYLRRVGAVSEDPTMSCGGETPAVVACESGAR